jgi:hypothetical protein
MENGRYIPLSSGKTQHISLELRHPSKLQNGLNNIIPFTLNQGLSLILLLVAGILGWLSLVLLETPRRFFVSRNQLIGLAFVVAVSILTFCKLYFTLRYNE